MSEFYHKDDRREFNQILTADIKQVNHYKAKSGAILGNHYHIETGEYFFIINGLCWIEWGNGTSLNGEKQMNILDCGDLFYMEPGNFHRMICISDIEFMTFLTKAHDKDNPDIWKNQ